MYQKEERSTLISDDENKSLKNQNEEQKYRCEPLEKKVNKIDNYLSI